MMDKNTLNFDELGPETKFLFIAFTNCALNVMNLEQDKKFYMGMAESIWEMVIANGKDMMKQVIQEKMQMDLINLLKEHQ